MSSATDEIQRQLQESACVKQAFSDQLIEFRNPAAGAWPSLAISIDKNDSGLRATNFLP